MDFSSLPVLGPLGYRFRPTEDELVRFFLRPKVMGLPVPTPNHILELDLYGENEPSEIWDTFMGPCPDRIDVVAGLYIFTKLKWLGPSDVDRSIISGGTWRNESSMTLCASGTQIPIAIMKSFRYENPDSPQDDAWLMEEYSLPISMTRPQVGFSSSSSYVVCRLSKNNSLESESSSPLTGTDEDVDYEQSSPEA
jgi:hypothetical protein